jgi:tRNA A-37 threonylcarbamoyl transferase component Bud32
MTYARAQGLLVPEVFDADGPDLVLERIVGPTMLASGTRRPWLLRLHAQRLAQVHAAVHAVSAPPWLHSRLGTGETLLHLDLHPDNVLLSPAGPVIIDWTNAARGSAEVDAADAWLIISAARPSGSRWRSAVAEVGQSDFARVFRRKCGLDFASGLPVAAARRLRDPNLGAEERQRIRSLVGPSHIAEERRDRGRGLQA